MRTALRLGAGLSVSAALLPAGAAAADAGLTGRWDLDVAKQVSQPGGGSVWEFADASGHGATGTTYQAPTTTTGKWGGAVKFGTKKAIAAPGAGSASAGLETPEGTLSLWFRYSGIPDEVKYLVSKGSPDTCENSSYAIYTGFSAAGTTAQPHNRGLQGYIYDGVDTAFTQLAPNTVFDGTWHAVAMVFKDGFTRLTVDGQPYGTRGVYPFTNPGFDINHPKYDDAVFSIGDNASAACGDQSFSGSIDEVRFYSRALSDAELTRLHNGASATPPDAEAPPVAPPADPDLDGDGAPGSKDCNDADPGVNPSAKESKGNQVDENCDGIREPFGTLNVNSVLSWKLLGSGKTKLSSLVIEGVRDGDRVSIGCKGGGCPKRAAKPVALAKVKKARSRISGISKLTLKPKARLTVTVAREDHVARVFTYTMARRKDPTRRARCQNPGDSQTYAC